jgi:radical SAM superfamily enzyme YgiQ (UPF0313 family)
MNILLINPPQNTNYPQPPLGLAAIASGLERDGAHIKILDANALKLDHSEVTRYLSNVDIVGITAMTPTISPALQIARNIKDKDKDMHIIIGGPHSTIFPEETLKHAPEIDFVVKGEGEETTRELVRNFNAKEKLVDVQGIAFRIKGEIVNTPSRPFVSSLDDLSFPAYHLLPIGKYRPYPPHGIKLPFMSLLTSRGCPFQCTYCSKPIWGTKVRAQSPSRTMKEIRYLNEKLGVNEILFYDDTFTINKKRTLSLCKEIRESGIEISWSCETRVDLVDSALLSEMKSAGCYAISFGVESGNQSILDSLRKGIKLADAERAFKIAHSTGIITIGYFMLGSPGETSETIMETIDFAKRLDSDFAQFSITTPFPGTELYDMYKGEYEKDGDWNKFIYAKVKDIDAPVFETELLSREDLKNLSKDAYKKFYMQPEYILKRLLTIKSLSDLKLNIAGFRMFMDMLKG